MLTRAYSTLTVKAVSDDQRIIEGTASTPALDRDGDVMEPMGAQYDLPQPLLWLHDQGQPVGHVLSAKVTKSGITIRAQFAKINEPGLLKDRLDEAWHSVKAGLVRGLSIGAKVLEAKRLPGGGDHVTSWLWLETSCVTIPSNQQASISLVKSLDAAHLAKSGTGSRGSSTHPPVLSGSRLKGVAMQLTISEKVQNAQAELTTKSTRLEELMAQSETEAGLTTEDVAEHDELVAEIEKGAKILKSLQAIEMATMGSTLSVVKATQTPAPAKRHDVHVVELEKGIRFARVARAIAVGRGSYSDTIEFAKRWRGQTPEVFEMVKAMVTKAVEGTSIVESPGWGGELVYANNIQNEFIELLRPRTIIGRIQGFRAGVFNTRMAVQTGGSTVDWVGEGNVKPVTETAWSTLTLPYHKMAGIIVLTQELVRLSSPSADAAVRDDLVKQIAQFMDEQFLNPSITATANRPASITNGVASPAASGTDADALYLDLNTALATFDDNEGAENITILMTPALARGISTLRNSMGVLEFPGLSAKGGSLMGYTVIVSGSVPSGTIVVLNPADILLADDGRVTLDSSDQATLDMAGGGSPTFNLWQRNCVGIRAERWVTYLKVRAESVAVIDTATYGPS
jgi:HK97 family phage major capsid protein